MRKVPHRDNDVSDAFGGVLLATRSLDCRGLLVEDTEETWIIKCVGVGTTVPTGACIKRDRGLAAEVP